MLVASKQPWPIQLRLHPGRVISLPGCRGCVRQDLNRSVSSGGRRRPVGQLGRDIGFGCKGISDKTKERPHPCQSQKQSRAGVYFCPEPLCGGCRGTTRPRCSVGWEGRGCSPTGKLIVHPPQHCWAMRCGDTGQGSPCSYCL